MKSEISGLLLLPFFEEAVEVEIGVSVGGDFAVKLASVGTDGLYKLTKPGIIEIELDNIGFELKDGVFVAKLSGEIMPLVGKDKGLKFYDNNNRPVRDAEGRLPTQCGDWGAVEELTLTEGERRWLALAADRKHCLPPISESSIVRDRRLTSVVAVIDIPLQTQ